MSRKGRVPVKIPSNVSVSVLDKSLNVSGPKGTLSTVLYDGLSVNIEDGFASFVVSDGSKKSFLGLIRSLLQNMVTGVSEGFEKQLELVGVGYRASIKGQYLDLQLGFSHPTKMLIPEGITVVAELKSPIVVIKGIDKQKVGQFASSIRALKKPEPYQGKGIRYVGEVLRRKAGKSSGKKK